MTSLSLLLHYSIFRLKKKKKTRKKRLWCPSISHFFIVLRLNLNDGKNDLDVIPSQYSRGTTFPARAETRRQSWICPFSSNLFFGEEQEDLS